MEEHQSDKTTEPQYRLRSITSWMEEHLAEALSLSQLAERAGVSEYHFNRWFKRTIGLPPSQYQIALRLDRAKRLLRETNLDLIDIANEVGYVNASDFARLFRKASGMTPNDYRQSLHENEESLTK
ncbi:helix-turn-helix domain-containing protein [Undibacterium sp. MH2W]|uniref:helix-turn-helix domain-containing protein n=1 Tax=Undibacterium sp. MH2W TaxID=3413044 RepID=UPI003BF11ACF